MPAPRIIGSSLTVAAIETVLVQDPDVTPVGASTDADRPLYLYRSTDGLAAFVNHGLIQVETGLSTAGNLIGFAVSRSSVVGAQSLFQNATDGYFSVNSSWVSSNGDRSIGATIGFYAPGTSIAFQNNGALTVHSSAGEADGYWVSGTAAAGTPGFVNTGSMTITSGYAAVGVYGQSSVSFNNSGTINAAAATLAEGVHWDNTTATSFVNNGQITATTDAGSQYASIGVSQNLTDVPSARTFDILNGGTIRADVAIFADFGTSGLVADHITNTGTITGAIMLSSGADTIDNGGTITGDIQLGAGNDSYNGQAGTLRGTVSGGGGDDRLIGGSGVDVLRGDDGRDTLTGGGGADVLTGGAGDDLFTDTLAGHNGDTITDLSRGDRVIFTDANASTFAFSLTGTTLTYSGGSLTLSSAPTRTLVASAASGGGVDVHLAQISADNDFNGDGRSDILWRNDNGGVGNWLGTSTGAFSANDAAGVAMVANSWHIAGTADFNGDGRADIVWRNDNGALGNWLGGSNGGFTVGTALYQAPTSWHIAGTGDFNGDGRADILWRSDSGAVGNWLGATNGGFFINDGSALRQAASGAQIVGTGDFNGDGRTDILWQNANGTLSDWLGTATGGFTPNTAVANPGSDSSWHVAGTGDFNGDGFADVLWRNDNGAIGDWLGTSSGAFVTNVGAGLRFASADWHVATTGDYNGDGRDDILWRNDDGAFGTWLGTANGTFSINEGAGGAVASSWHVQNDLLI